MMAQELTQVKTPPKPVAWSTNQLRQPKKNIPQTKELRNRLMDVIRKYVEEEELIPPLPLNDLEVHAKKILRSMELGETYLQYTAVCLSNEAWRETMAKIPFEKRLLLMPKCLRIEDKCTAPFDELGLLCKECGLCTIQDFQEAAEKLGYAVLVAEGSAVVMSLIQTGKIEAIVGISCLSVLERTHPYIEAAAIPSIAVPLLQDDCVNTTLDNEWIWDYIHLDSADKTRRMDLDQTESQVQVWFQDKKIQEIMGGEESLTVDLSRSWLAKAGKRWRPFLMAGVYQAIQEEVKLVPSDDLIRLAYSVESFHKASLIHDDIEDSDDERYGEATLHSEMGIPIALNVGDLLIGEGYRMISETSLTAEDKAELLKIAAKGHRDLCLGQGIELAWSRSPKPLRANDVIEIFRLKTSPAFEVAIQFGALAGGDNGYHQKTLSLFSQSLGIAYQIRDDLDDLISDSLNSNTHMIRPNILLAKALEMSTGADKALVSQIWASTSISKEENLALRDLIIKLKVHEQCELLYETYRQDALKALSRVNNASLKGLLRRMIAKIFKETDITDWCLQLEKEKASE